MSVLIWLTGAVAAAVVVVLVGYLVATGIKLTLALRDVRHLAGALERAAEGTMPLAQVIDGLGSDLRRLCDDAGRAADRLGSRQG